MINKARIKLLFLLILLITILYLSVGCCSRGNETPGNTPQANNASNIPQVNISSNTPQLITASNSSQANTASKTPQVKASSNAPKGNNAMKTPPSAICSKTPKDDGIDEALSTYMEASNLYEKLKKNPHFSRIDAMNQVADLLRTKPNVTDIVVDVSYRVIDFKANGWGYTIDDLEDIWAAQSCTNDCFDDYMVFFKGPWFKGL